MTSLQPIEARDLVGVWRSADHTDHIVVYADRETWSYNVGDIHYTGEHFTVTTWFIEHGELVTHEQFVSSDGVPSPNQLERRYAIALDGDELGLTDLDFDSVRVLRRELDPAVIAELAKPIVRVDPMTRAEPGLGTLRWHARLRLWTGETEVGGVRLHLHLDAEDAADPRPFDKARTAIAQLEAGALERGLVFASHELLALTNDWRGEGDPVLDAPAFRARMVPGSLAIGRADGASLGVGVGEVFGDHGIEIRLDADLQPVAAEMA